MEIEEIFGQAQKGDRSAEDTLYSLLLVSFRVVVRHRIADVDDAEDVVQEALADVLSKYKNVEIERSFAGWAHKLLHFKVLDYYKAQKMRTRKQAELSQMSNPGYVRQPDPELLIRLKKCLTDVHNDEPRHAQVLDLVFQGFSTEEICRKLDVTPNNFYVMLHRARKKLQACLDRREVEK